MSRDIDELISGYLDESLSEDEQRELADWIKADKGNAKQFAQAVMLHDRLECELNAEAETQSSIESPADSKVVPFPVSGFGTRLIQLAAAIVLMLTILYWPSGPEKQFVQGPEVVEPVSAPKSIPIDEGFVTIAHVVDVDFGEGSELTAGQRLGRHTIFMNSGVLRLQFDSGVEVTVQGPAKYELQGPALTKLSSGLLTANVPPGAEGFRVDTPTAEVTDLGTSFGVRLDPDGASHVSVFDGEVEVEEPDSGQKKLLKEGEAVLVTAKDRLETVDFDAQPYAKVWPVSTGIAGSSGAFELAPPWPRRLGLSASNDNVLVVPDGYRRRLRSPLTVNISKPGKVDAEDQLSPAEIPAGVPLRSFILYYQPRERLPRRLASRIQGSITFDRPIVGLILRHEEIRNSAGRFSKRKIGSDQPRKQVDFLPGPAGDILTLSEDRKTLTVDLSAPGKSSDLIRVIVDATPPLRLARRGSANFF